MEINFNYNSNFESLFENLFIECENESIDCQSIDHSFDDNFENMTHFEEEIIERNYNLKESDININLSKTKFNDLNDYCFLHLFSFFNFYQLMKLRIVCNKWKYNIDEYLKTKRNLKLINSLMNQTINIDIDMDSTHFRQNCLTIIANDTNCDNILSLMTKLCPKLISLEFIYVTIDEKIVSNLTQNFYDVNHLCFAHPLHVTEDLIKLVINYFGPQLKSLIIVDCDITEECLESIVKQCPNLETLDLSQNADITGESFQYLSSNLVTLRLSQCDSIEELGLNSMVKSTASHSITHLTISGMISDYMIKIIGQNMPNLKSFNCVYGCTRDFGSQTDHLTIVSLLKRLEKLSLQEVDAYYGSLDDRSLVSIMQSCNALKYLEIHVGSGEQLLVSDKSLSLIANYCSLIESLKIYYIETITDRSLNAFSKLKHLKELELINLYNIKDEGVVIITELCTNLTKLSISFDGYCDSITNITLSACIEMSRKRPKHCIEVNFFETSISVPFNLVIPMNMRLRVSWYRQTPEGRRYTQIKLPNNAIQTLYH
jgi:hypothetical protein